jgi:tRNA (guanosine-2'-O-)-methyltransferase
MRTDYTKIKTSQRVEKFTDVLSSRTKDLTIVLENLYDGHNLSAALRTCDATGVFGVNILYHGDNPIPKLGKKASASARKWLDLYHHSSVEDCFSKLRAEGKKIYTTHLSSEAVSLYDLDLTQPVALVFGNEHDGVSGRSRDLADGNFLVPQVGMIQSLNISVAVAVSLYEAYRQRKLAGMSEDNNFQEEEFNEILNKWLSK